MLDKYVSLTINSLPNGGYVVVDASDPLMVLATESREKAVQFISDHLEIDNRPAPTRKRFSLSEGR
jgi:hypothetical protein